MIGGEPPSPPRVPEPPPPLRPPEPRPPFRPWAVERPPWIRGLSLGCGLAVLVLAALAVYFATRVDDLLAWMLTAMERRVEAMLPEDLSTGDRRRVRDAFAAAQERVAAGGPLDAAALESTQRRFAALAGRESGRASREQVLALAEALERLAAEVPAAAEAPPAADFGFE